MNHAIEVQNLTKYYDKFLAVDHINFAVEQGEIFGFLGPNGAGKTTTQMPSSTRSSRSRTRRRPVPTYSTPPPTTLRSDKWMK